MDDHNFQLTQAAQYCQRQADELKAKGLTLRAKAASQSNRETQFYLESQAGIAQKHADIWLQAARTASWGRYPRMSNCDPSIQLPQRVFGELQARAAAMGLVQTVAAEDCPVDPD